MPQFFSCTPYFHWFLQPYHFSYNYISPQSQYSPTFIHLHTIHLIYTYMPYFSLAECSDNIQSNIRKRKSMGRECPSSIISIRAFLRPYGRAKQAPDTSNVFNRINPRNCEWLCAPQVALSELSDTMRNNIPIVEGSATDK